MVTTADEGTTLTTVLIDGAGEGDGELVISAGEANREEWTQTQVQEEPIEVKIIKQEGEMMLIQWNDGQLRRSWITKEMAALDDGVHALVVKPERGIPYGQDFAAIIKVVQVTPEMFDAEFKHRGIWTCEDVLRNASSVLGVVQVVYGPSLSAIYEACAQNLREKS